MTEKPGNNELKLRQTILDALSAPEEPQVNKDEVERLMRVDFIMKARKIMVEVIKKQCPDIEENDFSPVSKLPDYFRDAFGRVHFGFKDKQGRLNIIWFQCDREGTPDFIVRPKIEDRQITINADPNKAGRELDPDSF
ncbi:hypothetical protein KAR91_00125 [Candidatus Pacearchaeota archaeon]|nr:hypothetical protein [Candidatus Pacearchaeota archaeon]